MTPSATCIRPLLIALLLLAVVLPAAAQSRERRAEVILASGEKITGIIIEDTAETVSVRVGDAKIPRVLPRADVREVRYIKTLEEQYRERRAGILRSEKEAVEKYRDLYELSRWLRDNRLLDEASAELKNILSNASELPDDLVFQAKLVAQDVDRLIAARDAAAADKGEGDPDVKEVDPTKPGKLYPLSDEQISMLRLYEMSLDDEKDQPRIQIPTETLRKLVDKYHAEPAIEPYRSTAGFSQLRRLKPVEQVKLMFTVRARDLYSEIRVVTDPPVFREWIQINRLYVHPYFAKQFGSKQVVPSLRLFSERGGSIEEAYSNFMILTEAKIDGLPLIDRSTPEESLLLQYGLPRETAKYPAPDSIKDWKPFFTRGPSDPRFQAYVNWIKKLRYPQPQYPFAYNPLADPEADKTKGKADSKPAE